MTRIIFLLMFGIWTTTLIANNVQISNVTWDGAQSITFDISWDNSWRNVGANPTLHDAIWVFVKVAPNGGPSWNHVTMDVTDEGTLDVVTPGDLLGAFIRRVDEGTGTASSTLSFDIGGELGMFPDIKVFGIEMVYIPTGPFYAGDGTSDNRFHQGDDDTQPFLISSSGFISYGTGSGQIFTSSNAVNTHIPAEFPNGYDGFYCMKYEVSQLQYAEFLNCLTLPQQEGRTGTTVSSGAFANTYVMSGTSVVTSRNSVRCIPPSNSDPLYFFCDLDEDSQPNEFNDGQNLAMNYMSYDDLQAYLDWSALRPMTVLEYEKACRGPAMPVPGEYAWGTSGVTAPGSILLSGEAGESFSNLGATGLIGTPFQRLGRCGFAATNTSNRLTAGSTYYGVMEMTGNVVEFTSASFSGDESALGDGILDADGFSNDFTISHTTKGRAGADIRTISYLVPSTSLSGTSRINRSGGRGVR